MDVGILDGGKEQIAFQVSADKVLTWKEMRRSTEARWFAHGVHARKPLEEFLGPGLSQITFSVRLDMRLGIDPRKELDKMHALMDVGAVLQFTIGGELVGDFVIKSLDETWSQFGRGDGGKAVLVCATADLTLGEYVRSHERPRQSSPRQDNRSDGRRSGA